MEFLFSIAKQAADIYNNSTKGEALSVYKLPAQILEMFLDIPGRRCGFCLISDTKIVIFFDEDPNKITVIGKSRNKASNENLAQTKTVQLFKITFSNMDEKIVYKDNTGGLLDPYDLTLLLIKWVTS